MNRRLTEKQEKEAMHVRNSRIGLEQAINRMGQVSDELAAVVEILKEVCPHHVILSESAYNRTRHECRDCHKVWLTPSHEGEESDEEDEVDDGNAIVTRLEQKIESLEGQVGAMRNFLNQEGADRPCNENHPIGSAIRYIEKLERLADDLKGGNDRLRRGEFTDDEFQNLCHQLRDSAAPERFAEGCISYNIDLFGERSYLMSKDTLQKVIDSIPDQFRFRVLGTGSQEDLLRSIYASISHMADRIKNLEMKHRPAPPDSYERNRHQP